MSRSYCLFPHTISSNSSCVCNRMNSSTAILSCQHLQMSSVSLEYGDIVSNLLTTRATVFLSHMETIKSSTCNHEETRNTKVG
jgi:hypothetical protein